MKKNNKKSFKEVLKSTDLLDFVIPVVLVCVIVAMSFSVIVFWVVCILFGSLLVGFLSLMLLWQAIKSTISYIRSKYLFSRKC